MTREKLTKTNIEGKKFYYKNWRAEVVKLSDHLPEEKLALVTEPMLKDAWSKNETPAYFVSKILDLS